MNVAMLLLAGLLFALAACTGRGAIASPTALPVPPPTQANVMGVTGMMAVADTSTLAPAVTGYYRGGEVTFIHTEASDPDVAAMLTKMMGPRVQLVPALSSVPVMSAGDVYVFTNGVTGSGPFGFQSDVFNSVPGDMEYSPLRQLNLATWATTATPRVLRSVEEVREAERRGELSVRQPGVVVNMPILSWPGGHR